MYTATELWIVWGLMIIIFCIAFYVFEERLKPIDKMTQLATVDLGLLLGQPLW